MHNWFISLFPHIALDNLFGSICEKFTMIIHWRIMETEYKSFKTLERFQENSTLRMQKSLNHVLQGVPINMGIQWRIRLSLFNYFFDLVKWYLPEKAVICKDLICCSQFVCLCFDCIRLEYTSRVNLSVFTVNVAKTL